MKIYKYTKLINFIILFLLTICFVFFSIIYENKKTEASQITDIENIYDIIETEKDFEENDKGENLLNISIKRVDKSIKSKNGIVMGHIYYDKPVILENTEAAKKINAFFDNECKIWLTGAPNRLTYYENWYSNYDNGVIGYFYETVDEHIEYNGEESLESQSLYHIVDAKITFLDENILSIRQIAYNFYGGPSGTDYFGATFDLKTGDMITVDHFLDIDVNTFRDNIAVYMINKGLKYFPYNTEDEIYKLYGPNKEHNYEVNYYDQKINLGHEYYYDGKYINVIINYGINNHGGVIMRWNGKIADKFEASLIGYILQRESNTFKIIEYVNKKGEIFNVATQTYKTN